jgi:glycosyltransferase involved in cell wall biosynthesis
MKTKKIKVAIIIPAYNEEKVIGGVLKTTKKLLSKEKFISEIIVVDDGSTDGTVKKSKNEKVTVISHILNSGSGSATATGLSYAQQQDFDIAVTMDADGQHDASDVLKGINKIIKSKVDLLIGSRLINSKGMGRTKVIGNKGLSIMTFIIFGVKVTDSQSGLRIFSKKALANLKWKSSGYEFCSEMLWRAKQQGLIISEYPIKAIYTDYSKSRGQNNWNGINIIKSLLQRRIMEIFS